MLSGTGARLPTDWFNETGTYGDVGEVPSLGSMENSVDGLSTDPLQPLREHIEDVVGSAAAVALPGGFVGWYARTVLLYTAGGLVGTFGATAALVGALFAGLANPLALIFGLPFAVLGWAWAFAIGLPQLALTLPIAPLLAIFGEPVLRKNYFVALFLLPLLWQAGLITLSVMACMGFFSGDEDEDAKDEEAVWGDQPDLEQGSAIHEVDVQATEHVDYSTLAVENAAADMEAQAAAK
jgi:hypothetical protein